MPRLFHSLPVEGVWRTAVSIALTVELPPGTKLPRTPAEFRQAMNLKVWDLTRQAIEEAGDQARWEVGEPVRAALPGANVEPDALDSLDDMIMMSDQMMALLGSIDWANEPATRPLLTKDELEDFREQSLGTILEAL